MQSCIHVALEFVSPESLQECLHLTNELRCLPKYHHANEDNMEVRMDLLLSPPTRLSSPRTSLLLDVLLTTHVEEIQFFEDGNSFFKHGFFNLIFSIL